MNAEFFDSALRYALESITCITNWYFNPNGNYKLAMFELSENFHFLRSIKIDGDFATVRSDHWVLVADAVEFLNLAREYNGNGVELIDKLLEDVQK